MDNKDFIALFEKFERGEATPEEIETLVNYDDGFHLEEAADEKDSLGYKKVRKRILRQLQHNIKGETKATYWKLLWAAAAAAVIVFVVFIWENKQQAAPEKEVVQTPQNLFQPGNSAILTMADGKQIALNDVAVGTVAEQEGIVIEKQQNGILEYKIEGNANVGKVDTNTIATPRGSEYTVVLPDGTKVWLNAASALRFPVAFKGNEREVYLNGEAYFEVAKDKSKPFRVKFNKEVVEVLGTHFNIMAYKDEPESRTTLIEGSIKIAKSNISKILKPGQQAVSNYQSNSLNVQSANIYDVIAWKDGLYIFQNTGIETIMKQAQRWYDIEVEYRGDMSQKKFGGRISKYENIADLLKNLEITGTIHFKTEGKKIIVMP